jgi:threonyl-tRNA synthetase
MQNIKITFQGKATSEVPKGTRVQDVLKETYPGEVGSFLAAKVDGELVDLGFPLENDATVEPVTFASPDGKEVLRHSASHLMAQAVKEIFPETKLAIGPAIEDGFYYDFDRGKAFTPEDLGRIEDRMREIAQRNLPLHREELSKEEARKLFEQAGETYKMELIRELDGEKISCYRQGSFVDLCRGPHIPSTGGIKVFKLLNVAGAYWRGDERNPMLQRIYGTAYETEEDLKAHLARLEEIARRDHRKLGRELDLFSIHDEVGGGLVHWHPKGARMRVVVEDYWREKHFQGGYDILFTPHIGREGLWQTSGHLKFYKENMYSPMNIDGLDYYLKPVNCPFQIMVYKTKLHSYRDLPLRWAELGTVYRYERSGTLHGLLRVRGFTQDDAHIICTPEHMDEEVLRVLDFSLNMLADFGFREVKIELSVRDPNNLQKYAGADEMWAKAEASLVNALKARSLNYERMEGEAVFYGPKIDIKIKDTLGRTWQCSTIQFDFNMPENFKMVYISEDGREHRPYMVHRTLLGSLERFFGVLIEHYAGAFPLWLAPVQVVVLPITDGQFDYAQAALRDLQGQGFRAELDLRHEKIGAKIRDAETQKVPYMLVLGKREMESGSLSVRRHGKGDLGSLLKEELYARMRREVDEKATE